MSVVGVNRIDRYVGCRLRNMREVSAVDPERLAVILSINLEALSAYENGLQPIPATVLLDYCLHFVVPITHFFEGYEHADRFPRLNGR